MAKGPQPIFDLDISPDDVRQPIRKTPEAIAAEQRQAEEDMRKLLHVADNFATTEIVAPSGGRKEGGGLPAPVLPDDGDILDNKTLKLPRRILRQLDQRSRDEGRPIKSIVLEALRDKGFDVRPGDLLDNRGATLRNLMAARKAAK